MATIQKRGNTYKITVSCGYDMSGKQIRKNMTWEPSPGMTEKQVSKELERQKVDFEARVNHGDYVDSSKMRLQEFCVQYVGIVKGSLAPSTHVTYQRIIEQFINPSMGHLKLKDIKPLHVQMFIQNLQEDNVRQDGKAGKFASSSIRRYYVVLQSILGRACKLGLIPSNPADSGKIELPAIDTPKTEIFTKVEAAQMLECLDAEPIMYQALIHLAILTGCRRGELIALKWNDIDFANGIVTVCKSNYKLTGEEIKTKEPKTQGSKRLLSVPVYCVELLKVYKAEQARSRMLIADQWVNENWIFTQWNGAPMYPTTPTQWFSKFLARHDLPHRKFHALRHTSATLLLSNDTNIKTVAARLGHTQLSTTNRYVHAVTDADTAAAKSLGDMFASSVKKRA